ncbi:hypothetical protein GCM10011391_35000 [Pullulanibacillus camelliae]|uniref:Membrane-spanning protein n=1 Tax=Pullulanibacillus camelliae TaxID=1707096 RepID=A0A8J2YMR7_9BACL|nr:hypothetical protein GCM10011391_35000 [Pullulanibacillus camelliae]
MFWLLLLLGLFLALWPVIQTWPQGLTKNDYALYPRSAYVSWMFFVSDTYPIYLLIFPLLAALAFSDAYAEDFNTGLIKGILTKVAKRKYLLVRYSTNFVVGGAVTIFPLVINFLAEMSAYPLIQNNYYFGMPLVNQDSFWPALFYSHPFLYTWIRILIIFLFGGMLSSFALAFSTVIKNRYVVVVFPFLVYMGLDSVFTAFPGFTPISSLYLKDVQTTWQLPVYLLVGIVGSFVWYFAVGQRNETI